MEVGDGMGMGGALINYLLLIFMGLEFNVFK